MRIVRGWCFRKLTCENGHTFFWGFIMSDMTEREREERRKLIIEMRKNQKTLREIADEVDLTHQRVRQILKSHPDYDDWTEQVEENADRGKEITNDEIISEIRHLADKLGRLPKKSEVDEHFDESLIFLTTRFESLVNLFKEAGIFQGKYLQIERDNYSPEKLRNIRDSLKVTNERVEDQPITVKEYTSVKSENMPSQSTIRNVYGSWIEALIDAGITPNSLPVDRECNYTNEDLLDAVKEVAKALETKNMTKTEYDEYRQKSDENYPISLTIIKRFGGWKDAREKAGLEFDHPEDPFSKKRRSNSAPEK